MNTSDQKNQNIRQYCQTFSDVYHEHYGRTPPGLHKDDVKYLDLLSIFHFVVGGITALFACIPLIHIVMGIVILTGGFDDGSGNAPPAFLGWLFIIMGSVFIILGWCLAIFMFVVGTKLKRRKNRIFCMVIAGVECIFMPFGTVLGVFTIIILNKESVAAVFDRRTAGEVVPRSPERQPDNDERSV